ncbi:MAG TPA: hypothetical protein PKA88_07570 [Polyangiaceae bacterium]|nr:hypothetical protein [Polyangiaceae bacterium]
MTRAASWVFRSATVVVCAAPLIALLACKGDRDCRATLQYKGVTGPGTGRTKAEALQGGCWGYCGEHDEVVNAAWEGWKSRGGKTGGSKMYDLTGEPTLKPILASCQRRCETDVAAGNGTITYADHCK